ncbi:hypothetical protein T03_9222 [Trichinella britovi]|uniref:Uncharacterized protein n=1 Tax=Trichinella britovi TaxID=45882 RepID=A0A0V0Z0G0_TRIBR|nr:hypothetical protein T03_9222 [Trichinella britovi]
MKICRLFAFILLATTICQLADETESIPTNDGHTLRS